jgi:hypothetical protein
MTDYGLRVGPRFLSSALWTLTPRALRLYLFLAARSRHTAQSRVMADGQKVPVACGQWLTSCRRLQVDAGYRSPKAVVADLAELTTAHVVSVRSIVRQRFQNGSASVSKTETGGCFQNGNAGKVLATLITIHGINQLAADSASKSETSNKQGDPYGLSRDDREWERIEKQLAAEGR